MKKEKLPTNSQNWASPVDRLTVKTAPSEAINLNVNGRQLTGPLQGFGQLWQKTYQIQISTEILPTDVIEVWRNKFPSFWPGNNHFYAQEGVQPGEVAILNLAMPGGMILSTGVRVIYADDLSFSFMTPAGHMFGGMITFSAELLEKSTQVQIQALVRASDPLYEIGCRLGFAHKMEDQFWHETLQNLANYFNQEVEVNQTTVCVDRSVQWKEASNIWHNAAIRTAVLLPFHKIRRLFS